MIPILLISKDKKLINKYIDGIKVNSFFIEIIPSNKEYSIDDIKNLIKETKIFNPKTRVYFLENFNLSSIPAQNSFLKLLEEPPSKVQFVLSADNKNNLLTTIISRVKIIKLKKNDFQKAPINNIDSEIQKLINHTSDKIPLLMFIVADAESAQNIILQIFVFFENRLSFDKKAHVVIKEILLLYKLFKKNNLNSQLSIDQVLIFIWKTYRINQV